MDYTTVYEVTNEELEALLFFPLIFIFIGFGMAYLSIKHITSNTLIRKYVAGFGAIIGLFALIFSVSTIPSSLTDYFFTMSTYKEKNFKTVEGKVENFDPMPYSGHKQENFTVSGVEFDYSDFSSSYYGFNNSAAHGGPIKKNGQEARIGYITTDSGHNRILKIELKK